MATTTKIQISAADNEILLIACTPEGSSTLLHYKSGYNKPVKATIYPGAILPSGNYSLVMIGINWGGPSSFKVVVTTDNNPVSYTGGASSPDAGVAWSKTIPMVIVAGQ